MKRNRHVGGTDGHWYPCRLTAAIPALVPLLEKKVRQLGEQVAIDLKVEDKTISFKCLRSCKDKVMHGLSEFIAGYLSCYSNNK